MEDLRLPILMSGILLGLIPATIARKKGQSLVPWWLYGSLLFAFALPHAILLRRQPGEGLDPSQPFCEKDCPYCKESVPWEDDVCPSCHLHLYNPGIDRPQIGTAEFALTPERASSTSVQALPIGHKPIALHS